MRIHTSPSIQITEIDKSQYSPAMTGTKVYIQGFTSKGEAYRPMDITSRTAFTLIYGEPTTEAERYSYAAVCEALNNQGKVCFCRLPYDNESFEKLVGYKYSVSKMLELTSLVPKDVLAVPAAKISAADPDIRQYCKITSAKQPIMYDLSAVNEYRANESNVTADTFLIIDTTGATYSKITEDSRKGKSRELIGIVPVVTTAANALYAQSMISVADYDAWRLETISGDILMTLSGNDVSANGVPVSGLLESDLVKRINTKDFYAEQTCSFETRTIYTMVSSESGKTITLGDTFAQWIEEMETFIDESKLTGTYQFETLQDMEDFYVDVSGMVQSEDISTDATKKLPNLSGIITVEHLRQALEKAMNEYIKSKTSEVVWAYDTFDDVSCVTVTHEVGTYAKVTDYIKVFNETSASGKPMWTAKGTYVDPSTVKIAISSDDEGNDHMYMTGTMMEATKLETSVYHGVDGDDALPDTMCLDANNYFSTIQTAIDGEGFDPEHLKDIGVVVYKTYLDASEGNKVSWEPVEAFCGSLYKDDKDPNTGVTKFIDTIINSQSQYINFFSNCFSSKTMKNKYLKEIDILMAEPSTGASLGLYESMTKKDISINKSIYDGMNKGFEKVSDINERDIDIVCDAGLANIASYMKAIYGDKGEYDMTVTDDLGNSLLGMWKAKDPTNAAVKTWKTVEMKFDAFCKNTRKDCMFIADGLRPLVIEGQKKIIRETKPTNTLDKDVLPYLKCIAGLNTSYGAGYMNWFEQADDYSGDFFWCPPSIKAMGIYVNTDVNYNYWDAPAGLNRGIVACTDVSFSPIASQADLIYDKCWNYAVRYPNDGTCLEGQKTFQAKPSALDRVNVRRLFLRLERAAYQVSRYFLYEGNTAYTRQRLVDALDPYFKACKVGGGCYDYKIVCDESNNTPETIDQNELHVSIGIKPVKAVEYIMIDFIAASTGSSWAEIGLN